MAIRDWQCRIRGTMKSYHREFDGHRVVVRHGMAGHQFAWLAEYADGARGVYDTLEKAIAGAERVMATREAA